MFEPCVGVAVAELRWPKALLLLTAIFACLVVAAPASAEWFADLYVGGAFTEKHDVDTNFPATGAQVTTLDVTFDKSFAGGIRGGYWLPFDLGPLNFGVGLDISHFAPNVGRQTRTFCARFCVSDTFDDFDLSVWVIGFDAMLRYPLLKKPEFPNGQLQPYLTVGPAIFVTHAQGRRPRQRQAEHGCQHALRARRGLVPLLTQRCAPHGSPVTGWEWSFRPVLIHSIPKPDARERAACRGLGW